MRCRDSILLAVGVLWGCVTVPPGETLWTASCTLDGWIAFLNHVDQLEGETLMEEYTSTLQRFLARPKDVDRLRLAYLLSHQRLPVRNTQRGEVLLQDIDPAGDCAPYAVLTERLLAGVRDLDAAQEELSKLRSQLDALKGIDVDITDGREELEELTP